jgi:hypothetical protein
MPKSETLEIEEYLREVSEQEFPESPQKNLLAGEGGKPSVSAVPREYQSALVTFESPLMEYIRNLREKTFSISKEISFISSIYSITSGKVIKIIDEEQGEDVKNDLFDVLYPLAQNTRIEESFASPLSSSSDLIDPEIKQILNRCFLVIFSNFSQMQAAIIQGIIYDIERQGVHLPIQSSNDPATISQQYKPIVQNQAVIIRNMFRHLFPQNLPPDNIHILELCFLGLLDHIQQSFQVLLLNDEQLLQMLSRIKVAQDELLNVKDPQLCNSLAKMERIQNRIHDIYNQQWRDGILNDIISTFFYHARFIAYLENKGKISQKRRYFLVSLEHLLGNYDEFYRETLYPQVEQLMAEYKKVDVEGDPFVRKHIKFGRMKTIFQEVLDEDKVAVLSEMIVTKDFSKTPNYEDTLQYVEELEDMHQELCEKHEDNKEFVSYVNRLWEILDDLQELIISEIFTKWQEQLTCILTTYCQELFWFHGCFSTYTLEGFPQKALLFRKLDAFINLYRQSLTIFSDDILRTIETLSQEVYAFRDRAGDFNLLYTGILDIDLRTEEKLFQFELYTPVLVKSLATRLSEIQERYMQALQPKFRKEANIMSFDLEEDEKNHRVYTDEIAKTAGYLAEERDMLMYCGSRKLFTGPQFEQEDFAHFYNEVIDMYEHAINQLQLKFLDPLDSIVELKSLREFAQFEVVYERYTEVVKYRALRKAWELTRKKERR